MPDDLRARIVRSVPNGWPEEERRAYLTGLLIGTRAPELALDIELLVAKASGRPAEQLEEMVRTVVDFIRGETKDG